MSDFTVELVDTPFVVELANGPVTVNGGGGGPPSGGAGGVLSGSYPNPGFAVDMVEQTELSSAISALSSVYQPLDSDLTAIAALTTTSYGRALLALADAAALRTAGGLVIGTDVEAHDADLTTIAGLSPSNDDVLQRKSGAWTNRTIAQLLTDLGLGSIYQPLDSDLTAIAALTTTSFGRSVLDRADAAALRTLAGTVIGTDVQAFDSDLATIAGLTATTDSFIQAKGSAWSARTIAQVKTDLGVVTPPTTAPGTISGGAQNYALPNVLVNTGSTRALSVNRMWYVPFLTYASIAVDRLICDVTTNVAASNLRMGVYAADTAWQPSGAALIDTGDISAATTGAKVATVSATLTAGRYLICVIADTTGIAIRAGALTPMWGNDIKSSVFGGTNSVVQGVIRVLSRTYGALSSATPWDDVVSNGLGTASDWPLLLMRWT